MCYNMLSDTMPIIKSCNQLVQVVDSEDYLIYKFTITYIQCQMMMYITYVTYF